MFQIEISLIDSEPKIWRKISIPSDLLLSDFHKVIQTTMGWTNSHLHQFIKDENFYAEKHPDADMWDEMGSIDYKKEKIRVSDLLKAEKDTMIYEYDFGDGWEHKIVLEKISSVENRKKQPYCLDGKMNCPPEDCGGIWGYKEMLEVLKQPKNEGYEELIEWLGDEFDPKYFNKTEVNKLLKKKDFGCFLF